MNKHLISSLIISGLVLSSVSVHAMNPAGPAPAASSSQSAPEQSWSDWGWSFLPERFRPAAFKTRIFMGGINGVFTEEMDNLYKRFTTSPEPKSPLTEAEQKAREAEQKVKAEAFAKREARVFDAVRVIGGIAAVYCVVRYAFTKRDDFTDTVKNFLSFVAHHTGISTLLKDEHHDPIAKRAKLFLALLKGFSPFSSEDAQPEPAAGAAPAAGTAKP